MKSHASMNRIYRLVWNAALGIWVAVAENAKGRGKSTTVGTSRGPQAAGLHGPCGFTLHAVCRAALPLLASLALFTPQAHGADAANATVSAGAGSVATTGTTTTIHQASQKLAIDWTSLSTRANEALVFNQPNAQAIALNRITGSSPSEFLGSLTANGQVFILNPNGVLFGAGSQVNVGGLVASTLNMSNADFLAGNNVFTGSGGAVVNKGTLNASSGGYLALLAPEVRNEGVMTASLGTALLAAGNKITLNLDNGNLLGYSIDQGAINALAENKLLIQAHGGQVLLSAKALDQLTSATVNNTGIIEAKTLNNVAGRIVLGGDMDAGQVFQLGTLNVSAPTSGDAGSVRITSGAVLDAGQIYASSAGGKGGSVDITASGGLIQTTQARVEANGATGGGSIALLGHNVFSSATLEAKGTGTAANGGTIDALAHNQVALAAATLDASGTGLGGRIRIGGDFQGANAGVPNARTTIVNGASSLRANGGSDTDGGKVIVWSEDLTRYHGDIEAKGGEAEVSSRNELQFGGTVKAKTLLLDPKNITISAASGPAAFELIDPNAGTGRSFGSVATQLGTTSSGVFTPGNRMAIGVGSDNGNRGAVYLYDTSTGALVSTLTGSTANDNVGGTAVIALSNGNYVVRSSAWDNGALADAGAVTWGNGTSGVSGVVSAANSLVGSAASDNVGAGGVTALSNGNYVVRSQFWDNGAATDAGAATWGNGTSGVSGAVSAANSLVGSTTNDNVGGIVTALSNGNYVVSSSIWDNGAATNAGAATWGNGTSGVSGAISAANSLVGSTANDQVSSGGVTLLSNGNYVVRSSAWDNGALVNAGAVTWGNGAGGTVGAVSAANSLVGSTANDIVGGTGVTALSNGNYVVRSQNWDNGAATDAGAATWGNGTSGVSGAVSAANSLVGTTTNDNVGIGGLTALSNGNYVVSSGNWDNGALADVGAVTWGNGTSGVSGAVSAANSLVGSTASDFVGSGGVTALSNGNYVVISAAWDNGAAINAGAATWGNGAGGTIGAVSAANSLVGSTANDQVSGNGVTALSNGNYVVRSQFWDNGAVANAGAVTWGNGTGGTVGAVSAANSLVGGTAGDSVGSNGLTALSNGNYVVNSNSWDNGAATNAGAVTWGNGAGGMVGAVSAANSLVGSTAFDSVGGSGVTALSNGNYVVLSSGWDNGAATNAGAATWGNGTSGVSGAVSAANSLVGSIADDSVGSGVRALSDGNYVVNSSSWDNGAATDAGAATWGNGARGTVGAVSAANSLVGSAVNDRVSNNGVTALSNGNYVVRSGTFNGGSGQVLVGVPGNLSFATASSQSLSFNPDNIKALLAAGTAVTLQASNDITVASAINVTGSTGGTLTLQAGRSILFNANVSTANGNLTAVANDPGAIPAHRDAGSGDIVIGAGVTLNVGTGTANLSGQRFVNNSGATALQATGAGRWLVWSGDPANDTRGGLAYDFNQYNATYGSTAVAQAAGNGFLYTSAPTITSTPQAIPAQQTTPAILAAISTTQQLAALEKLPLAVENLLDSNTNPAGSHINMVNCGVLMPTGFAIDTCQ